MLFTPGRFRCTSKEKCPIRCSNWGIASEIGCVKCGEEIEVVEVKADPFVSICKSHWGRLQHDLIAWVCLTHNGQDYFERCEQQAAPVVQLPGPNIAATPMQAPPSTGTAPSLRMHPEEIEVLTYQTLVNFVKNPPRGELKTCAEYIKEAAAVMPECILIEESIAEVSRITISKLEHDLGMIQQNGISDGMLMAIVFYTFDLCMLTLNYDRGQCWYYALNKKLRERKIDFLKACQGYLYYLMTGLWQLTPYGEGVGEILYRGIDEEGATRAIEAYRNGIEVHWSGFSSATPDVNIAKDFAGRKGLILRIKLLDTKSAARNIRELSALGHENEVLLLPNFKTSVYRRATLDPTLGLEVIDLTEMLHERHIF